MLVYEKSSLNLEFKDTLRISTFLKLNLKRVCSLQVREIRGKKTFVRFYHMSLYFVQNFSFVRLVFMVYLKYCAPLTVSVF